MDKNGIITDIQLTEYFFGVKKEELIGKKYYDLFPKPDDALFENYLQEALKKGKLFEFEVYFENEGNENWFLITIIPNENGFSIHFKTINEIKRLEEKLKKTKENYKRILENSGEIIIEFDSDFKVKYINAPFFAGYGSDELIGSSIKKFIHSEDGLDFENILKKRKNRISTKFRHEQKIITKSGDLAWFNVSTTTLKDKNNRFKGLISILSDITHLKETEMGLRDINMEYILTESSGVGIFLLDRNGEIKYSNKRMNEILGHINPLGKYLDDFMNIHWSAKFKDILDNWENGLEEIEELRLKQENGEIIWVLMTSKVIYNSNNNFLGVLGIVNDISLQKNIENSLIQREEQLKSTIVEMSAVLNSFIKSHYETNEKFMDN